MRTIQKVTLVVVLLLTAEVQFSFGQKLEQDLLLDSLKLLGENLNSSTQKVEVWYQAAETMQRSSPKVVLQISKMMADVSQKPLYLMGLGMGYEQMGNAYYYLRKADSSVWAYRKALDYYRKGDAPQKIFTMYNYLVFAYRLSGNKDSTILYVKKEMEQAVITNDSAHWATALHDNGFHLSESNQLQNAINSFFEALKYVKPDAYNTRININNGIGDCYHVMGNDSAALRYFHASKEIASTMSGPKVRREYWLALSSNRISSTLLELGRLDDARIAIQEQMSHAKQTDDTEQRYTAFLNYGMYFTNTKQYDSAEYSFLEGMRIQKKVGRKRAIGIIHYNISGLYNNWKKFSLAFQHADSANRILTELNSTAWQTKNYHALAVAYAGLERYKEAYEMLTRYVEANGKIMTADNNQKIAEMQAAYDVDKKDAAITVLNKENELRNSQRNFFIVAAASLLATAMLVFYLYSQKQKSNMLLFEKNGVIEKSLAERETLLKEIHHRVKNNLQIITSLLSLQSKSLVDSAAQGAISESRNRVKSMSLIHEQLYQEDTISGVEMNDYISRLVSSLTSSYGLDTERIEIKIESENILLDVDSAIPLGLIINELVSNSMKYAFPNQRSGAILISLKDTMNELLLMVKDDGVGMDASIKADQSFGLSMVNSLMRKLKAEISIVSQAGTSVQISIKDFKRITLA